MPYFPPKHAAESVYSFRLRLAAPDLPYDEDDYWALMRCPRGHHHIHGTYTTGDRAGEQYIFCNRGRDPGCRRRVLFTPSSSLRLELAKVVQIDKQAQSIKGKTKTYEDAKQQLAKAKLALTKATDAADGDGENIMDDRKVKSASHKLAKARTKLERARMSFEASHFAREALDDAALCRDQTSLRVYLVKYGLADSIEGSERRLLESTSFRAPIPSTKTTWSPVVSTSSVRSVITTSATEGQKSTRSSDRITHPSSRTPSSGQESKNAVKDVEWPSDVELVGESAGDPDWPSEVEVVAESRVSCKRKRMQDDRTPDVKRRKGDYY